MKRLDISDNIYFFERDGMTDEIRLQLIKQKRVFLGYGYNLLKSYSETFDRKKDVIEIWIPQKQRSGHMLVVGATGSGKTVYLSNLLKQDIFLNNKIIYVDPKGDSDLFKYSIIYAKAMKRFNPKQFLFLSPLYLDLSIELNPLWGLDADEAATVLVSAIPEGKEPFFKKLAFMVLLAVLLAMKGSNQNFYPSILDIAKYFSLKKLKALRDMVQKILESVMNGSDELSLNYSQDAALVLDHLIYTKEDYFEKVTMSLKAEIDVLVVGSIGRVVGKAKENILYKKLANGENIIFLAYLGAMRYGDELAGRAARMIFSSIQRLTGKMYQKFKVFDPPLSIYGDEAKNLFYNGIEDLFNKVRGANIYLTFATQSLGDIAAMLGPDKMRSILGNTNTQVILRALDDYTLNYIESNVDDVFVYRPNFLQHQLGLNQIKQKAIQGSQIKKLPAGVSYSSIYGEWYKLYSPYEAVPESLNFEPEEVLLFN